MSEEQPSEEEIAEVICTAFCKHWFTGETGKTVNKTGLFLDYVNGSSVWLAEARAVLAKFGKHYL
jgi:hypothetical protein